MPETTKWRILAQAIENQALNTLVFLTSRLNDVVEMRGPDGNTLLHLPATQESLYIASLLLECGLDVNHPGAGERTALHEATPADQLNIMRKLLDSGAEVDKPDGYSDTPIFVPAMQGSVGAISIWLDAHTDVNKRCGSDETPFYISIHQGREEAAEQLLRAAGDVNMANQDGWTPSHAAEDNYPIIKLLVQHTDDPNINVRRDDDYVPLHLAASWGHSDVVKFLLDSGANPNLINRDGRTPLHSALANRYKSAPETLSNYADHLDLNRQDNDCIASSSLDYRNGRD